ncbi:transaldolase [Prochlorococcus phage P-GSP1]|uniref:Transaldolase n=1 Tax=Prochlorococcus phage P-GSP1 TaxID=382262 RepID=M1UH25_9CAUD|nr:transaldolase [Prochlorococcus phage P-GSP1]AGG54622.1 transaldolase [Prochlorococcus phage P-GSP1]
MKLFLDSAIIKDIDARLDAGVISGVTTNPTLIKKSGREPDDVYADLIQDLGVQDVSIEVDGKYADKLIENGIQYGKLWIDQATIKLPCTPEGIKACKMLNFMGIRTNMTLVFSVSQAILCALAGATYVSPFVGRLDDNGHDGIGLIREIAKVFCHNRTDTKILAASIRDAATVGKAFQAGAHICTIPPKVYDDMYKHVLTDKGLFQFLADSGQA